MIIFGTRGVTTTPEQGDFFCPSCDESRQFGRKRVRRFFTLYFIPLIPLDKLSEYIECTSCKDTFRENVLEYDPEAQAERLDAEFKVAVRRTMALIALADGDIDDSEIESMVKINKEITGQMLSSSDMRALINATRDEGISLSEAIEDVAPYLNDQSKERVVEAAFKVAMADGDFHEEERQLVMDIGAGLNLTKAHLKGVLAEMEGS